MKREPFVRRLWAVHQDRDAFAMFAKEVKARKHHFGEMVISGRTISGWWVDSYRWATPHCIPFSIDFGDEISPAVLVKSEGRVVEVPIHIEPAIFFSSVYDALMDPHWRVNNFKQFFRFWKNRSKYRATDREHEIFGQKMN